MRKGQSLVEVFVALGVGILIIGGVTGSFVVIARNNDLSAKSRNATITNDALLDSSRSFAGGNWTSFYALNKGSGNVYNLINTAGLWVAQPGTEAVVIGNATYTRSFYVENVSRDASGNIESVYNAANDDPSTQKITVQTSFSISGSAKTIISAFYAARIQNFVVNQTDWSGGSGQAGPITAVNSRFSSSVNVDFSTTAGSISPTIATCSAATEQCEVISGIYDTGFTGGVGFNTIMWQGTQPSGSRVQFKLAVSNSPTGPWNYGAAITPAGPNIQSAIDQIQYNNARYFQYKIIFDTAAATPAVTDVIISLSR